MNNIFESGLAREIKISEIEGVRIGHAQDETAMTGCSVLLFDEISPAGVDVRGGSPASRETALLDPRSDNKGVNAVFLSGGSAFGLDCATGIMKYLEERGVGFETGWGVVPLVTGSCIFDLAIGDPKVRPDAKMGYAACLDAEKRRYESGPIGGGCGATVGKFGGRETCMKSGLGTFAVQVGDLKVGAIVVVNAVGDIYDTETGEKVAGMLKPDKSGFADTAEAFLARPNGLYNMFSGGPTTNTTIGAIVTNGKLDKAMLGKAASMAHNGFARAIRPVHTTADGDTIYAISCGNVTTDVDVVGTIAAEVMARAITRAVRS
ncbi:MAG: P1 family peptidase [Lachnospiraceae bacterium]|nr:P1 family peptidase [Lachnospiraceae bacterium]